MTINTLCLSIQRRYDPDRWAVRICPSRFEPVRVPPVCRNRPVRALQHRRRQPEPESKPAYLAFSRYDLRFDLGSGNSGGGLSVGRTTWTTSEDCCGWSLLKERGKVNFRKWNVSLLLLCSFVFFMCCWRVVPTEKLERSAHFTSVHQLTVGRCHFWHRLSVYLFSVIEKVCLKFDGTFFYNTVVFLCLIGYKNYFVTWCSYRNIK